jgi:hypothetical protein
MTQRFFRKCIKIRAADSPNVICGDGLRMRHPDWPSEQVELESFVIPGVVPWAEYHLNRRVYDPAQACVSLDAEWYEGPELKMFPAEVLARAQTCADGLRGAYRRAKAMGIDPGEGEAETVWCVLDELGVIELLAMKTKDTSEIPRQTLALMRKYGLKPEQVCLDRGGGGKQIADQLRSQGFPVRTVAFGETILPEVKRTGVKSFFKDRIEVREDKSVYFNRRAEMYFEMGLAFAEPNNFALPRQYGELHRQLSLIPRRYDSEGKGKLPPKNRVGDGKTECLVDIMGCSPDQADALCVAGHCLWHEPRKLRAGGF